ncbi:MAG: cysteine hydrolase family protein [Candidatus Hodarchaeales archaeon]|jgi:nicotinamidase-related amidase
MKELVLLLIDLQIGNFTEPDPIYLGKELISKISQLIVQMRAIQVPIIYIQNNGGIGDPDEPGTPGWGIHPFIAPQDGDKIIQKSFPDAFHKTSLKNELKSSKITEVIIAGLQSEYCIDTTCRRAYSLGYKVTLVEDAHSTWNSQLLTAQQIIDHHGDVLGSCFATLKKTDEIIRDLQA